MMRLLSRSFLGAAVLGLSACSNQYFERKDSVTFSAGDAVAWNKAQMIADPTPRRAYDRNIVTPGETAARAGGNYASGRYKWYTEPGSKDEPSEVLNKTGASNPDRRGGGDATSGPQAGGGAPAGGAPGGQ
ncbi:hypothetical protein [uncultured Rhodoblastus sp.]|uniref:hypothetical protein n=1 Tax=uncultured Rhodoblastus sp. TaxID=543037 RepID=UPI0025CD33CF|nr:hypothetical protein [uncultured Rhodoblastus sp.]